MKMTPDARASLDATVQRVMGRHHLPKPLQSSIQYELMSHLHAAAERKAAADQREEVTSRDLNEALLEMGGESALAEAFVAPLARPLLPAPLGRRAAAVFVDYLIVLLASGAATFVLGMIFTPIGWLFGEERFHGFDFWDPGFEPDGLVPWSRHWSPLWILWHGAVVAAVIAISAAYYGYFEGREGRTLGKKVFDLRVVRTNGEPMTPREALIRNAVKLHPSLLWLLAIDAVLMFLFFKETGQRASDRIAETQVVDDSP